MAGSFYQPAAVICDIDVLESLPRREFLSGYAEIVKYGLINDPEFFIWLEKDGGAVCDRKPKALSHAIATACRKKAEIVEEDEREEQSVRALLNFGHTFGHALEAVTDYDGRLLHGEAVSIGMVLAFQLSHRMGLCSEKDVDRVIQALSKAGLPTAVHKIFPPLSADVKEIIRYMKHDKKAVDGKMVFILARGIGKTFVCDDVEMDDVEAVLAHSMKGV